MPLEGQQLGHYRLTTLLGSGGMGEVYRADDLQIPRQVAVKVIRIEGATKPGAAQDALRLFKREAQAIASLQHPNILPLYEYNEEATAGATLTYIVMPICPEGSLGDWLERNRTGPLPPSEVAYFLKQAAEALQEAHDQGIVHQDIKPANFLIRKRKGNDLPDLLLADFGVAKLTAATGSVSQSVRGTPNYMAPEQWKGHPQAATDQYALGIMAYELLTGQLPFQGSYANLMYQHIHEQPTPLNQQNRTISPELSNIVLRAMAKEPQERFPSVLDFAQAFEQATQGRTSGPTTFPGRDTERSLTITNSQAQSGTTVFTTSADGQRVLVPIPSGTKSGDMIRVPGRGELSETGGPAGALLVRVIVAPRRVDVEHKSTTPGNLLVQRRRRSRFVIELVTLGIFVFLLIAFIARFFHLSIALPSLSLSASALVIWLVVGLIAGFLASVVMRGGGYGIIGDIIVGIVGAFIGGFLMSLLGLNTSGGLIYSIIVAFIGSCILIAILRAISRGRRRW